MKKIDKATENKIAKQAQSDASQSKRRALVASIAAAGAGGLPSVWKKPVVDHVLLPAHADMSVGVGTDANTGTSISTEEMMPSTEMITVSISGYATCIATTVTAGDNEIIASASGRFTGGYTITVESFAACTDPFGNAFNVSSNSFVFSGDFGLSLMSEEPADFVNVNTSSFRDFGTYSVTSTAIIN